VDLVGPGGLLTGLTKSVLETALDAALIDCLTRDQPISKSGTRTYPG
jgi:hypothetical protein